MNELVLYKGMVCNILDEIQGNIYIYPLEGNDISVALYGYTAVVKENEIVRLTKEEYPEYYI